MKAHIIVLASLATLFWGLSFPITTLALESISPLVLALWRYALAIPFFLIILVLKNKNRFHSQSGVCMFALIGLFGVAIPISLQNTGMLYASATISSILQSTGPLFTIFLAIFFLKEPFTKRKALGIVLASFGTFLALNVRNPETGSLMGNVMILFSALSYSISGILAKYSLNKGYNMLQLITFSTIFGTLFLLIVTPFIEKFTIFFSLTSWMIIIILAVFPTFLSFMLWYTAMRKMEISRLSFFIYLIPVYATLFSYILLKQLVTLLMIFSGVFIIMGIAIAQTHRNLNESQINKYDAGKAD